MKKVIFLQEIQKIVDMYRPLWFFQDTHKFSTENIFTEVFWWYADDFISSYEILSFDEDNIVNIWFKKESIESWEWYYKNILEKLWNISWWDFSPKNIKESWNWDDVYNVNAWTKIKLSFSVKWKEYFVFFTPWITWSDWDRWEYLICILQQDGYLNNLYAKSTEEEFILFFIDSQKDAKKLILFEQKEFKDDITNIEKLTTNIDYLSDDIEKILSPTPLDYQITQENITKNNILNVLLYTLIGIFTSIWFIWSVNKIFEYYTWEYDCHGNIIKVPLDEKLSPCLLCLENETQEQCDKKLDKIIKILEENVSEE